MIEHGREEEPYRRLGPGECVHDVAQIMEVHEVIVAQIENAPVLVCTCMRVLVSNRRSRRHVAKQLPWSFHVVL